MIKVVCVCGHVQNLADRMGGKFCRCPKCGGTVAVPDAPPPDDGDTPAPDHSPLNLDSRFVKTRPPPPPAPGALPGGRPAPPAKIACPSCHAEYGADAIFCQKCAILLATGEPVAGLVPGGVSGPRAARRHGFDWRKWLVIALVVTVLAVVAAMVFRSQ